MTKLSIIFSFLAAALFTVSSVSGFAPQHLHQPTFASTSTQLDAAPTMVIYWTIKSAIDYVGFASGQTDKWQGTGVWSGLKVNRDDEEGGGTPDPPPTKNTSSEEKEKTPKSS